MFAGGAPFEPGVPGFANTVARKGRADSLTDAAELRGVKESANSFGKGSGSAAKERGGYVPPQTSRISAHSTPATQFSPLSAMLRFSAPGVLELPHSAELPHKALKP